MAGTLLQAVAVPWLVYAVILVLLTIDAFIPVVPTQALMIGGGLLAASGELRLCLVVAAGVLGAVAGDASGFALGRRFAGRSTTGETGGSTTRETGRSTTGETGRSTTGETGRRGKPRKIHRLTGRLTDAMQRHAFLAMLFCRFVPAGRMAASAYAGRNGFAVRRFLTLDLVAATLWATYAALLGRFGGEALASSSWLPLAIIGGMAVLLVAAGSFAKAGTMSLAVLAPARAIASRLGKSPTH